LGASLSILLGNFGRALINPPRQLWARPYQLARQTWARPYQSVRQQATISTLHLDFPSPPHIAWGSLLLFVHTADPPSPSYQGQRDPHTPPPLLSMVSSDAASWPRYGHLEITQTVRLKSRSNWSLLQFTKQPSCGEMCIQKFSCFSTRKGACCTGLPAGLPIKENRGEPDP
jgi:hypothetical protein